ncbi:hypothetical protein GOP47_0025108 [Adiantum capillus-veneris]|uniref:Uncharacterized protein n=1 Tax=Adiantum capillus-veneris TaxID=13818 RepID=A0A9D4U3C1_ADICA|nr:hypothetical protein GOP47_0025108 [Adiantum capillus-veneris]
MASLTACSSPPCPERLHRVLAFHPFVPLLRCSVPISSPKCFKNGSPVRRKAYFCVRAMEVSGPIESALMNSMTKKLKEQLNTNDVIVKDAYGDGRHVSIQVVSADFEGKTSVNRQRMVYKAIWEELQTTVHAVDNMLTWTPEEAAQERSQSSS